MDMKYIEDDVSWAYSVNNHFNSQKNNTNELATIARRHGFEQLVGSNSNNNNNLKLKDTNIFFTNKTINSDLNAIDHTDIHDDYDHEFCYLCSINQCEHERTKPRDESQRRKLIPYKNPKARLSSSAGRTRQKSSSSDLISYRFIVRTGTQKDSGTRAQVFLYMYGTENNWTSIHLQGHHKENSSASSNGFPSGSIRTFCLKGPHIGQLHHLNVNLVGSRSNKEWFLKEIEITNLNTSVVWLCEFNCWLPKTDEQEINPIKPTVHQPTEFALSIYVLQIRTGEKSFAGTDANVHVTIRGSKCITRRLALTSNRANLFEQNQLDTFAIVGTDLGDLLDITVESDRSQLAADWDIKEMILWKIIPSDNREKSQVYFPFNTWLGKKVSTLKSKREIYPSDDHHLKGPICYEISVKTGKVVNAGTDANVFLIIYGNCGRTVIHQLNNQMKNDFERNSISEFMIMDIDVGKIDRIKIWHDNSGVGSAWFLDSVIIRKKYSTCYTISNIYIQRLEQISKILYRQIYEHMTKNSTVRTSSINEDKHRSIDRQSLKSNDSNDNESRDRLGNGRGILRSPIMYDKASLQKKVTWNEGSIGSQDDLLSINSQRSLKMQPASELKHKKDDSINHYDKTGHLDHQTYWISSHNYIDNRWKIESIEETNSLHLDQSIRSLLLSDRSTINKQIKTSVHDNDDEIYECQANRWLAKDKEDGKLEVYLPAKLIHKSSIISEKKHITSSNVHIDSQHKKYDDTKESLKQSKSLTSHDLRSSSSRLPNTSKTQLNDLHSLQRNINPSSRSNITLKQQEESPRIHSSVGKLPSSSSSSLTQLSKSPRHTHELTDSISNERGLLAKITGEPFHHSRTSDTSLISSNQRLKSPRNLEEREFSARIPSELPNYLQSSSNQHLKSSRNINDRTAPIINERHSLTKSTHALPDYPRSSAISLASSDQNIKSLRSNKDFTNPVLNSRDSLAKISHEPPNYSRSIDTSMSLRNQPLKSPRHTKELMHQLSSEQELLARTIDEPLYRSSTTSSLNQRGKLPRNTNDHINSSINERETLAKMSPEPRVHPRLTSASSLSSNQFSKSIRTNNESPSSLTKIPIESLSRPKSAVRSTPKLISQKSIHDQIYSSAYGTAPSDDF